MTTTIRISAALMDDDAGRLLLVRKAGTRWFMQPGGKVEPGETALSALERELRAMRCTASEAASHLQIAGEELRVPPSRSARIGCSLQ